MPSIIYECILQPNHRRYSLALPEGYTEDRPYPLILALHFAGHGSPFYGKLILTELVEPALRKLGAIIVAPDCSGPDWIHPQSEMDVLALLDYIHKSHNIDPDRTLITGYSMGGIGTWYLAARHQERFSAALILAGTPPPIAIEIDWQIPLLIIQSRQDEIMPLEATETAVAHLIKNGYAVKWIVLEGITHYETWRYTAPLSAAVPWIQEVWGDQP